MIGSRIKSKICCFSGRRGRRPLQAKIQTASTRRHGAKTLSFPGRRVLVATRSRSRSDTTPWCHSLRSRRFATSTPTGKNSNRIDTPIRSENLIVSGPSGTPVPTNEFFTESIRRYGAKTLSFPGRSKNVPTSPLVGRGLVSRRFGSMKSVCNGGTKAPPYNSPLTHLRWDLPPRGAFRKMPIGKKFNPHKRALREAPLRDCKTLSFTCHPERKKHSGGMFLESNPTLGRAACAARWGLRTNFRIPSCRENAERAVRPPHLIVGGDVLDAPRRKSVCFACGYNNSQMQFQNSFVFWTVGDAGPYKV